MKKEERAARDLAKLNDGHETRWEMFLPDVHAVLAVFGNVDSGHFDKVFALNSKAFREVDASITQVAVGFANKRDSGTSATMNGWLDYAAQDVVKIVRKSLFQASQ